MYDVEVKIASQNGWLTPDESRRIFGRYSRNAVTVHWWGGGEGANMHDAIVNVLLNGAAAGTKSSNYVVSDNKISMLVHPDNVAFASTSGNPVSVSIEFQPTLGDEGYKKGGWLIWQLELRYGVNMQLYPHNYWNATQCPGSISLDRLAQEANKWAAGQYSPTPVPPTPTPSPTPVGVTFGTITPSTYIANKDTINLYQVNKDTWAEIGVIRQFNKGDKIDIFGVVKNPVLGAEWYVTKYSYDNKLPNGFSKADLDLYIAPVPAPAPEVQPVVTKVTDVIMYTIAETKLLNIKDGTVAKSFEIDTPIEVAAKATYAGKEYYLTRYGYENKTNQGFLIAHLKTEPTPTPAPTPVQDEWITNLQDKDDTTYWFAKDQDLIDITTGKPALNTSAKKFLKGEEFVSSAMTVARGVEYRITDYSYRKGIYNGVPIDSLTLFPAGEPVVKPVPQDPTGGVDKNAMILFLESLVKMITDFLARLRQ